MTGLVPPENTIQLLLPLNEIINLRNNSVYYKNKWEFENLPLDEGPVKISIMKTEGLEFGLCIYMVCLNCRQTPELPDFGKTKLGSFLRVCTYYGLDHSLQQAVEHFLSLGVKYLFNFLRILNAAGGREHPLLLSMMPRVIALVEKTQMEVAAAHRTPISPDILMSWIIEPPSRELTLRVGIVVKAIINSVATRTSSFFPVCFVCWKPVRGVEGAIISECCKEPVHVECYNRHQTCRLCRIVPASLRRFVSYSNQNRDALYIMEKMRSHKILDFYRCPLHDECFIRIRHSRPLVIHVPRNRFPKQMDLAEKDAFLNFIENETMEVSLNCFSSDLGSDTNSTSD